MGSDVMSAVGALRRPPDDRGVVGWTETRGSATATAVRRTAHSDDAKQRVDDASHSVSPRFPKWVPLAVAGALVVLVGTGATAALVGARDEDRTLERACCPRRHE